MQSLFEAFSQTYGSFYKTLRISRGLTYRYLSVPGTNGIALVWLHGFPSSVYDWHYQIDHFHAKGYALIVPDLLGYGGTDKPTDSALYKRSVLAADIIEIVDKEAPSGPVVAIAHDHGVNPMSRLADIHADRFAGFAFLAVGYFAARPEAFYNLDQVLSLQEKLFGKPLFSYWTLFTKSGAPQILEDNFDSFVDMIYAKDIVNVWTNVMTTRGKAVEWVEGGKRCERASFVSENDYAAMRVHLLGPGRGMTGPLNWYKNITEGFEHEDDKDVAAKFPEKFPLKITKPVFFAATARDAICRPEVMRPTFDGVAHDITVVDFDTSHWVYLEQPAEFNEALEKWLVAKVPAVKPQ